MRKLYIFLFAAFMSFGLQAQTIEDLKTEKASVDKMLADSKAQVAELEGKAATLQTQINKLSGWLTGLSGKVGFNLANTNNWISSPNPTASSSSLGLGVNAFANNIKEKTLWRNSILLDKQWQDIDLKGEAKDNLFDNGTVDILNGSSLYGYRVHPKFAITGLGEFNTSLGNFFKPGTVDIGVGGTWTPTDNLVVIVHPLNYHMAFSGFDKVDATGALGAKLRAEYNNKFNLAGLNLGFSSILTGFYPYSDKKTLVGPEGNQWEAGLTEYTWMNRVNFIVWKGIGVSAGLGFRKADFESRESQRIYDLGLGYTF